jgi:hypothetical protein
MNRQFFCTKLQYKVEELSEALYRDSWLNDSENPRVTEVDLSGSTKSDGQYIDLDLFGLTLDFGTAS